MIIVFSGFQDDNLKTIIEAKDGRVANSLVKNTTHMIIKKNSKTTKKIEEAKQRGIIIITLDDFLKEYKFEKGKGSGRDTSYDDENMKLIYTIIHTLQTKENKEKAIDALTELGIRISSA